ncbi:MAG: 50S ribosomal protein L11 methyltransferase [Lachnospiraceae bacterium]|nr:50S ribosomal protein L11 methyltransferase [Lachnospiraceae bacterium]
MKWVRFRISTTTEAEDIIISDLYDIGLEGAQIEDNVPLSPLDKEKMFVDIPPETGEDDGSAFLNFFVEVDDEGMLLVGGEPEPGTMTIGAANTAGNIVRKTKEDVTAEIKEVLEGISEYMEIGEGSIEVSETDDIDWLNNWKNYFHSFEVDDILVIPSWEEVPEDDAHKYILHIDPGTAFGTGMHATTQLCIRNIRKHVKDGDRILDIGTGSGILAILGLMFGAGHAFGTDLDPCAEPAVSENLQCNGISADRFDLEIGNIVTDDAIKDRAGRGTFDIVVANIITEILEVVTPCVPGMLKEGGIYITSGILNEKEKIVTDAIEKAGLTVLDITRQGEWSSVASRK